MLGVFSLQTQEERQLATQLECLFIESKNIIIKWLKVKAQISDYAGEDSQYISKITVPLLTRLSFKVQNGVRLMAKSLKREGK